jgi:structural hemagglutinin/hemolysin toxin protein RtxA
MYLLSFYVPESHLEQVKKSLFNAGAGRFNNYEQVAWQTKGIGQFCPTEGSNPYLGKIGKLEKVVEYKVEMICAKQYIKPVIAVLKASHPYEEPAYNVIKLENID